MKIVAVLYPGGPAAAAVPELLGCAENALGIREWVESQGHELVAISDTEAGLEAHLPTTDTCRRQISLALSQRGWNAHPCGMSRGLGTSPIMGSCQGGIRPGGVAAATRVAVYG